MTQWPEDQELSRLYREMPEALPGPRLKERVLAVAMEHTAEIRRRQTGKNATSATRSASPVGLFRGWWVPVGLAASVVLSVVSFLLVRSGYESQSIVVAQQDITAATPESIQPPPSRIRIAEVEPARRNSGSSARNEDAEAPEAGSLHDEGEAATAQASSGFPDETAKEMNKGSVSPEEMQPVAWLDEIRTLQKQGKLPLAKEKMRQFRRKYPDYPLPDDLRLLAVRGL